MKHMNNILKFNILFIFALLAFTISTQAQDKPIKVSEMSKEQLMDLTYDDLLNLSFEDIVLVSNKFGMSSDELMEYFLNKDVTSASKRAEKSLNAPLSISVISKEELENSGATCIPEALRLVPGVIVREKTNGNYDVHIRGNDNVPAKSVFLYSEDMMTLVMIDGRPVYNYAFGGTFWESLPIEISDVERIEVIRGPSSALYGPNAVAGAINIVTQKVDNNKLHVNGQVQAGTANSTLGNLALTGGVNKFKYRVSGNYSRMGRFEEDFYVFDLNKKLSYNQCDTLRTWGSTNKGLYLFRDSSLSKSGFRDMYNDLNIATEKYGANAFLFYDPNKDVSVSLSGGMQQSDVITTPLGILETSLVGRYIESGYVNLNAKAYGFSFQASHNGSHYIVQRGTVGMQVASQTSNASLEYEHSFGSLVLRPGISFQQAIYDDSKYIDESKRQGFLNGAKALNAGSAFLRADYRAFDKLRLIAAVRADKYNHPDDPYFTYQFISSYDINDNNMVRIVYSRANRGPFVADTYADYDWTQTPENSLGYPSSKISWIGNNNLKLPVMDMYELGYRFKPFKNMMVDLEAFYTKTKNFSYLMPDQMSTTYNFLTQSAAVNMHVQYYNFDLTTLQKGITANVSLVASKKLTFKLFGTLQETQMNDFYDKSLTGIISEMSSDINSKITADGTILYKYQNGKSLNQEELVRLGAIVTNGYVVSYTATNADLKNGKIISDSLTNTYNKSTPSFFGGGTIDYRPIDKLNITSTFYYFSENKLLNDKQSALTDPSMYTVQSKFILNLKVSYKFYKNNALFVNARNALNNQSREFAYVDKVSGLYLVGLNFNF
jgi:iron complex outermembrane receptor protein